MKMFFGVLTISLVAWNLTTSASEPFWNKYIPDGNWDEYIPGKNNKKGGSTRYGPTVINDEILENLTIFGPATIIDSTITGTLSVKGPLEAENSEINDVDMDGVAEFDSCKVKTLSIRGPIYAKDSKFSVISVYSKTTSFSNSVVEEMTVKKNNSHKPSSVILENSKIHSLSFEEGNGRVALDDASSVSDLHGGKIIGSSK